MEQADHSRVLGRERELAEIDRFVAAAPSGPRALVLEGSAGIGKTTLWEAGIGTADAAGIRVLDSRAAESEATLSYSGLGDLFDPVFDGAGTGLPEPQRRALDAALLRADDAVPVPDRRAISLGALGVVRTLAARSPLLIALDDVQWLDTSTANVVAFVLRRLAEEPVRIIASQRHGAGTPSGRLELAEAIGRDRVDRITVGPLDEEATGRMLRARLGADLSRPVILRIHAVSQGNPLFALGDRPCDRRAGHPAALGRAVPCAGGSPSVAHGTRRCPARRRRAATADGRLSHASDRRHGARRCRRSRRSSRGPRRCRGRRRHRPGRRAGQVLTPAARIDRVRGGVPS